MASKWLLLLISWEVIVCTATGVCNRQLGLLVQLTSKTSMFLSSKQSFAQNCKLECNLSNLLN